MKDSSAAALSVVGAAVGTAALGPIALPVLAGAWVARLMRKSEAKQTSPQRKEGAVSRLPTHINSYGYPYSHQPIVTTIDPESVLASEAPKLAHDVLRRQTEVEALRIERQAEVAMVATMQPALTEAVRKHLNPTSVEVFRFSRGLFSTEDGVGFRIK